MSTNANNKLTADWVKDKAIECCLTTPAEDPACTDCCYDNWRDKLKSVNQQYSLALEDSIQLQKHVTTITDRKNRYKSWLDELDTAEELTRAIFEQLELLAGHAQQIWYSSCKTVEAIETLFCMIRHFYSQLDYLQEKYQELDICISKNTDPALAERDKGIRASLTLYYEKLDLLLKTRDGIIKDILTAIKIAHVLRNNIYTKNCKDEDFDPCSTDKTPCNCKSGSCSDPGYGFKKVVCEWYCSFKCDESTQPQAVKYSEPSTDLCNIERDLEPAMEFPICNSSYKGCVKKWYEDDVIEVRNLNEKLKIANQTKESSFACKQSLDKAIAEADPKNRCK